MNRRRHHFALARAVAHFVPEPPPRDAKAVVQLDRDQSVVENYGAALWIYLTATVYLMELTPKAAWPLMPLLSPLVLQLPLYVVGSAATALGGTDNRKLVGVATMAVMLVASSYFATAESPVRYVAWIFVALFALNAVAAIVLLPVERR